MGLSRTIPFLKSEPSWGQLATRLQALGEQPLVRMIDGLPAFPDETPPDEWRELRISLSGGMVTIRRAPTSWTLVTWGTTDATLNVAVDRLVSAINSC